MIKNTKGEIVWIVLMVIAGAILSYLALGLATGENRYLQGFLGSYGNNGGADEEGCGIVLETPEDGGQFVFPFTVAGKITGCGWTAFEGEVGSVAIVDGNGLEVSVQPVPASSPWMASTVYFDHNLSVPIMDTNDGTLIFRNTDASGENPLTFEVDVNF